jgi:phage portal protein BeeE
MRDEPCALDELAEKAGIPDKPSYKRLERLRARNAALAEAESRGALTPEERRELARIKPRIAEREEKAGNRR